MHDPEIGFTSDVIKDPNRFVGRQDLISSCIKAINSPTGLIAVYGKRGVGKSSLLRQIQQLATGDFSLPKKAKLAHRLPESPRKYLTVYYTCDSMIQNGIELLQRLCNDQSAEDGLLRLVPDDGKELIEFSRSHEASYSGDIMVAKWGGKGVDSTKYAKVVPGDITQTFRNFVSAIVTHQVKARKRDALLILLDELDVIQDKSGLGSIIKSLTSPEVKFGICGIGDDINDLVKDHGSVERLLESGALHVKPMNKYEIFDIFENAEHLFEGKLLFSTEVKEKISQISCGYPYFAQLIGKECVHEANNTKIDAIGIEDLNRVIDKIRKGEAFPTLESAYQRAIGSSEERRMLLHLLAEQDYEGGDLSGDLGKIFLKNIRKDAQDLDISYTDQLVPRLIDVNYGPVLRRNTERPGIYEFVNPVFRLYVKLRSMM